jgi:CheY-like chemotaxis protein
MTRARILLVEDNPSLRRAIARALGASFGAVEQTSKGDEAVERLRDRSVEPYDVVVADLRLPGANGIDVLRAARERDTRIAVVLMTAYGSIQTAVEAMKLGAFDFVRSPSSSRSSRRGSPRPAAMPVSPTRSRFSARSGRSAWESVGSWGRASRCRARSTWPGGWRPPAPRFW